MTSRHSLSAILLVCAVAASAWYLRDPAWLISYSSGLHPPEVAADGRSFRWTKGHASFFVPSQARRITLALRSLNESENDWPITATVTIDDRIADRFTFRDQDWHELALRLPAPASRRVRRIDIKLDRVRSRLRGVQLGDVKVE
ncbi:MAG: hypothetical protein ABIS06_17785 [Vicinamibacterales bacterium]